MIPFPFCLEFTFRALVKSICSDKRFIILLLVLFHLPLTFQTFERKWLGRGLMENGNAEDLIYLTDKADCFYSIFNMWSFHFALP